MSDQKYLFIGGKQDGKWMVADGQNPVTLPFFKPIPVNEHVDAKERSIPLEDYFPMRFTDSKKQFVLYVLNGISVNEVMESLIERYSPSELVENKKEGELLCYAYITSDGDIDFDSIAQTQDGSIAKMIEGCLGWRYQFAEDQDRMYLKLLKYGRFAQVRVTAVDADVEED